MSVKLKTLKDIGIQEGMIEDCFRTELRQEAIKWIKSRARYCEDCNLINVEKSKLKPLVCNEHKFWMERFNITEGDLK
jgi:hypothetical protein